MASSLFLLLDDIASLLDDVAAMTKVAAGKTAGVLGDDLALNAEQVAGVVAERELPVVWAVCKGSLINKAILVPAALGISAFVPWLITPLLMCGGAYLCFEGCEKLFHKFVHPKSEDEKPVPTAAILAARPAIDLVSVEKEKIKGAIRTDFILSAEIIVISLGTMATATLLQQVSVLTLIAIGMTLGVYGLVAGIVKLDDLGYFLLRKASAFAKTCGRAILSFAPLLMKALSNLGMLAMFLVGGGILVHGIHPIHELANRYAGTEGIASMVIPPLINFVVGFIAGAVVLAVVTLVQRSLKRPAKT